ncbi:hypothetical protein SLE2022_120830 [Rubroshorea leprosula]
MITKMITLFHLYGNVLQLNKLENGNSYRPGQTTAEIKGKKQLRKTSRPNESKNLSSSELEGLTRNASIVNGNCNTCKTHLRSTRTEANLLVSLCSTPIFSCSFAQHRHAIVVQVEKHSLVDSANLYLHKCLHLSRETF